MSRRQRSTLQQLATLSLTAPAVAATRVFQIASTTGMPTAAQRRDHARMGMEKLEAFQQGWMAMGSAMLALQQRVAGQAIRAAWTPWWAALGSPAFSADQAMRDADTVLAAGLAPVSRAVASNARRQKRARRV